MKYLVFFLISLLFISCASKKNYNTSIKDKPSNIITHVNNKNLFILFNNFYHEYKGVRYKYGGNNKKGLDCSSFVQKAYKHALNISIPRTTHYQAKIGKNVSRKELELGDLVFFRPSAKYKHVGIYLKNGEFMHVSSSRGVKISKLSNLYWKKHYWKSIRVIN